MLHRKSALLALSFLTMGSIFAATKIFPYPYVQEDLPNGLRLITIPTDYPNIVSLYIVVGAGSRNEVEPGKSGFARQLEVGHDIVGHPALDLAEDASAGAIERIVQVENPAFHMTKIGAKIDTGIRRQRLATPSNMLGHSPERLRG